MKPLSNTISVARPILVDLNDYHHELKDVWASNWFTNNGGKHRALERMLADEIFRIPYVSLVSNATMGLLGALKLFELSGEVITTPFTFPATPHAITWAGLEPVFCDIDPQSLTIDPSEIVKKITKRTTAILGVHVFGNPCHVQEIDRIAKEYHLKVIYDAAHAFELEINEESIASFGDASVFSFHATKLFHTAEGGAVVFKNADDKRRFDRLKNFGLDSEMVEDCGINFKMNELQAALGLVVMKAREVERVNRQKLSLFYQRELKDIPGITILESNPHVSRESVQYFGIRITESQLGASRDRVVEYLKELNVQARRYFFPLCSDFPHYQGMNRLNELPNARRIVQEVLCLPFHGGVTEENAVYIGKAIRSLGR